jgi:hypothetical protein
MSNGFSDTTIGDALNYLFGLTSYSMPTGHTLHLYIGDPHGAGLEVDATADDTAYLAQSITFELEGTTTPLRSYNDALMTFAAVVYGTNAASYEVSHWAVKDSLSTILNAGAMPTPVDRVVGEPLAFAAGALYVSLARTP